ncbi:MAG: hypothetical protein L3J33_06960 [Rhodobacteraceae bacterium]|nr:hypothetical protein [Paracoccaceae bacterium]
MTGFWQRLAFAYGSAIILMFFSEYFFVNEAPVSELLHDLNTEPLLAIPALLSFAGFYTLFTYPMLVALSHFNVRSLSGLLLAGALFGWATEGITIPVIYESIPFSFIFPSIGWHALIDVLLGWYLLRLAMRKLGWLALGAVFILLGVAWGMWATWFWGPEGMAPISPQDFELLAAVTAGFWLMGMIMADRFGRVEFKVSKWEFGMVGAIYLGLFWIMAMPYLPLSLLILPLVGATLLALWRGQAGGGATILARLHPQRPRWWAYVLALLTPLSAVLVYPLMLGGNWQVPTQSIVVTLLLVATLWFIWALVAPFIRRPKRP